MDHNWPRWRRWRWRDDHVREAFTGQRSMGTWVIEVTEFNFEVSLDLRGHMEVAMASEATKMAVGCNMGMDIRVIKVTDVKSDVI